MAREGVTFRSVVERGLREVLRAGHESRPFALQDASIGGRGLQAAFRDAGRERIRDAAYEWQGSRSPWISTFRSGPSDESEGR